MTSSNTKNPTTILIANRGIIACRIIRTLTTLNIPSVAIYSSSDCDAPHVQQATHAALLGKPGDSLTDTYLNIPLLIAIAAQYKCTHVHPGYGFLSENVSFARAVIQAGMIWIGPTPEQMETFGSKHMARALATQLDIPLLRGTGLLDDEKEAIMAANEIHYPVLIKSTNGGGGIGMAVVESEVALIEQFRNMKQLASNAFGDGGIFLEKYLPIARHIEVQIFGDEHGHVVALGERDCSTQRRNQKIVEETPAPNLHAALRAKLHATAIKLTSHVGYRSAGTVEFLVHEQDFFFLEVNTRLQVEHAVTEMVYGIDLVEWQVRLATQSSWAPPITSSSIPNYGHAIQVRVYAEDPKKGFLPSSGLITQAHFPSPPVRVETWIHPGTIVSPQYDPLLAKIIVHAPTREEAVEKLHAALVHDTRIDGSLETNLEFLRAFCEPNSTFCRYGGKVHTKFVTQEFTYESNTVTVVDAGTLSIVVDGGRVGHWRDGVPPSGAMDDLAFRAGNRLVGNKESTAASLEMTLCGATLLFHAPRTCAVTGADMGGKLVALDGGTREVTLWTSFQVNKGDVIKFDMVRHGGARTYLAVSHGGWDVPQYMNSKTTFIKGKFGGYGGRALQVGDVLHLSNTAQEQPAMTCIPPIMPTTGKPWEIRVLLGPHGAPDFFQSTSFLFDTTFGVHYNSNRLGIRLLCDVKPQWTRKDGGEAGLHPSNIHDTVYAIGSINFTGDLPVILTQDGPSLGGFVCPITIIRADMWKVGQLSPRDTVKFVRTSFDQARRAWLALDKDLTVLDDGDEPSTTTPYDGPVLHHSEDVVVRLAGDCNVLVEFGQWELDFASRFKVYALERLVQGYVGKECSILETAPGVRSLQIRFDGHVGPLVQYVLQQCATLRQQHHHGMVPSRIMRLPLAFDASTTKQALEMYSQSVRATAPWLPSNIEFIRRINGLNSVQDVANTIFSSTYLVLGLGDVYLGAPCAVPIDPRHRLVTTKFNPARTWTAEGEVGIGGVYMCIYGMESPGGYQLVGRSNQVFNVWRDSTKSFRVGHCLLREFDQVQFYRVSEEELNEFRAGFISGRTNIDIQDTMFDLDAHVKFLQENKSDIDAVMRDRKAAFEKERDAWVLAARTTAVIDEEENGGSNVQGKEDTTPQLGNSTPIKSTITGSIWKVLVQVGDKIEKGSKVVELEAMKMIVGVESPTTGVVVQIMCTKGKTCMTGDVLVVVQPEASILSPSPLTIEAVLAINTPTAVMSTVYDRIETWNKAHPTQHIFISLKPRQQVMDMAKALENRGNKGLPLFGIPFVAKDNIDVFGLPTTCACPDFAYEPRQSAYVIKLLEKAGAICIGKTNMDQFAAGLVGVRSPHGPLSCVYDERFISGGSSSGSAIAVASGICCFSLGTDTAGSGRVPAAFNNLVGFKPTRGVVSCNGVVPAAQSLDCVSIFGITCGEVSRVWNVVREFDAQDPYSRRFPMAPHINNHESFFTFGVPDPNTMDFMGDMQAKSLFQDAFDRLMTIGGVPVIVDYTPWRAVAEMLYGGPWLAERLSVVDWFLARDPAPDVFPVTRAILENAKNMTATQVFLQFHEFERLKRQCLALFENGEIDVLVLPTTATTYTIEQVQQDPVKLNSNLGVYTNFANLLDLCAVAVPSGFRKRNGLPFGISIFAPAFQDDLILRLGEMYHDALLSTSLLSSLRVSCLPVKNEDVQLAVCGLHLEGQPLHQQLLDRHASLVSRTQTAPLYKLFVLKSGKPALVRVGGGTSVEVEVYSLAPSQFGDFIAHCVPPPLCIGNVTLVDQQTVKGFLCEAIEVIDGGGAKDISEFGGWRGYAVV